MLRGGVTAVPLPPPPAVEPILPPLPDLSGLRLGGVSPRPGQTTRKNEHAGGERKKGQPAVQLRVEVMAARVVIDLTGNEDDEEEDADVASSKTVSRSSSGEVASIDLTASDDEREGFCKSVNSRRRTSTTATTTPTTSSSSNAAPFEASAHFPARRRGRSDDVGCMHAVALAPGTAPTDMPTRIEELWRMAALAAEARDHCKRQALAVPQPLAATLVAVSHKHHDKWRELKQQAEDLAFEHHNGRCESVVHIDLHGQSVEGAVAKLNGHLSALAALGGSFLLCIVTGVGKHSKDGVPRVLPAVIDVLAQRLCAWDQPRPGLITVKISSVHS
eukprot:jgi/Chlat1/6477/Chrsp45S05972